MIIGITFRLSDWQFDPLDVAVENVAETLKTVTAAQAIAMHNPSSKFSFIGVVKPST